MAKITADTLIAECLQLNPNAPDILMEAGMHCFGCAEIFRALIFSAESGEKK